MLGCVTTTRPFYLILELCDDNLLNLLHAKAQMLREQREREQEQMSFGNMVNCADVADKSQNAEHTSKDAQRGNARIVCKETEGRRKSILGRLAKHYNLSYLDTGGLFRGAVVLSL